jgi:hypothetical protein
MFLEFWKGYSQEMTHKWDTIDFTPEEEHPRPEYLEELKHTDGTTVNLITQESEPKVPYWTRRVPGVALSASTVLLMVLVVLAAVIGIGPCIQVCCCALLIGGATCSPNMNI